jgi:asparagine synthase (glutamine-hydrolysing)
MIQAMLSRGPDDVGQHLEGSLGLGFRRLSIVDLAGGHQPLTDEQGSLRLVLNGEIYNYPRLRPELLAAGHKLRSSSDAEAVLHLYQDHGDECMKKLDGMFAFALWDPEKKCLLLCRDRMGIKPLYYHDNGKRLIFASSLRSLLADRSLSRQISLEALNSFMALRYVPAPDTIIQDVKKLEPGCILKVSEKGLRVQKYWDIPLTLRRLERDQAEQKVERQIEESVRSHLMSDVPVAAFLSGGIDSSIAVGAMVAAGVKPLTFSAGFDRQDEYDELHFAQLVAKHWGLENQQVRVGPKEVRENLADIVRALEEPLADPAAIPGYFLSQLAARQVKVVLTGEGADETFAGYKRYHWAQRRQGMLGLISKLGSAPAQTAGRVGFDFYRLRTAKLLTEPSFPKAYQENVSLFNLEERRRLYGHQLLETLDAIPYPLGPLATFRKTAELPLIEQLLYADSKYWLADDLLIKMDKVSMAHSLEARVPFLDHHMVELAWSISPELKYKRGVSKQIFRVAGRKFIPREVFHRPKHGFDLPLARWLRGPLGGYARDTVMESTSVRQGIFKQPAVESFFREHMESKHDRSFQIFALLCWALWEREFLK